MGAMISLFLAAFNGWCANFCFKNDSPGWGWLNLFFSAWNFASFLSIVL